MILILNLVIREASKDRFNDAIAEKLTNQKYETFYPDNFKNIDLSAYERLIISGSEACAFKSNPWDQDLANIAMYFVENSKPVLGICYGHQFLASILNGKDAVCKSKTPEFGVANIKINCKNELFAGIDSLASCVLHFDEVKSTSKDIHVIASGERCKNHAFQYKDLPVWGVQFHPEYTDEQIKLYIDDIEKNRPETKEHFVFEKYDKKALLATQTIFNNFISI